MGTVRKRGDTWRAEVWCHGRRISATRDIRSLSVYYRESATDIAARLD